MNCPVCGGDTIVRGTKADCESVHRRRICVDCGHIFFTSEYETDGKDFTRLTRDYQNSRYYNNFRHYLPKRRDKNDLSDMRRKNENL